MSPATNAQALPVPTDPSGFMQPRSTTIVEAASSELSGHKKMLLTFSITLGTLIGVAMLYILVRLLARHRRIMMKEKRMEMQPFHDSATTSKGDWTDDVARQV
ncbi:uncharacterized protein MYCFIDRAFT_80331 [Pseudocercospora fijiensis CIRAD86]|uniref:Uncharacterized protein n=1 Tax=Pseudocercospora fijiensis (strain CIRAD86) TaxID=383855 RepID=M3ADV1_PSEFD|nr:uncharacterized protein MYCFIDRAFT_80331 [Pseudocercospora fijiensis CIRAD86]EME82711.1 hypothetical protein MYCFIDRAFT_80331 [Pseudocercospora fijiensis CIRAD86]